MLHQVQTLRAMYTDAFRRRIMCTITANYACDCFHQQIENGNIDNQIHGFSIDFGKLIYSIETA